MRPPRAAAALALGALALGALTAGAEPAAARCRLALALALDVSSSVDAEEHRLQAEGLAAALVDPSVVEAILAPGPGGGVALAVYEWSGRNQQALVMGWTMLDDVAAIGRAAEIVRGFRRSHSEFPTALGEALGYGSTLLRKGPDCVKRTLDVAGDGRNNDGFAPHHAYGAFDFRGVTVNALVVGGVSKPDLTAYFRDEVIRGDEAFTELASDYSDFARAMRLKLLREVRPALVIGDAR